MISKSSLVNQIRHNCKRRIWCFAIFVLGFFVTLPLFIIGRSSQINNYFGEAKPGEPSVLGNFFQYDAFTPNGNYYVTLMLCIAAILAGVSGFCYLNSKTQVDFYHGMPVSRIKLFSVRFISGYILFLIPYTFNLCVAGIIATVHGGMTKAGWENVIQMFGFHNIYFLALYTLVCLAVIISGNLLNNLIMIVVFMVGEAIAHLVLSTLSSVFFCSFYQTGKNNYLTPFYMLFDTISVPYAHECDIYQAFYVENKDVYKLLLWIVITIAITAILFYKRSSEKAGKAIVFPWMELMIKMFLTVLVTYSSGFICESIFSGNSFNWFMFGQIAGFVLSHMLLEILFRGDFRAVFKHFWHWGIDAGLILMLFAIYWFDVFGYDSYIPKKEDIEYAAVSFEQLDTKIDYIDTEHYQYDFYRDHTSYRLDNMKITDVSKLYELIKIGIQNEEKVKPWSGENISNDVYADDEMYYSYDFMFDKDYTIQALKEVKEDPFAWSDQNNTFSFVVKYKLKNGREIYRSYEVDCRDEEVAQLVASIYDQPLFKLGEYQILSSQEQDENLVGINVGVLTGNHWLNLSETQMQEFVGIYREELSSMTFDRLMSEDGIGVIDFEYQKYYRPGISDNYYYFTTSGYPLYPSFTKTIEFLDGLGIDVFLDLTKQSITSLRVVTSGFCYDTYEGYQYPFMEYAGPNTEYMEKILSATDWNYNTHRLLKDLVLLDVEVGFYNEETGEESWSYGKFKAGEVPDFVLTDMVELLQE